MVSWPKALVPAVVEHGHRHMMTTPKGLCLYIPGTAFSPILDALQSLLTPTFATKPSTEHITIHDDTPSTVTMPCPDSAATPANVTCIPDTSSAPPPLRDSAHLTDVSSAILPQRVLFDPPAGNPPKYETGRVIDPLHQQHERELLRLWEEHQSRLQALKAQHDASLKIRENAHDASLRPLPSAAICFGAHLHDSHAENQRLRRQAPAPALPNVSFEMRPLGNIVQRRRICFPRSFHADLHDTVTALCFVAR